MRLMGNSRAKTRKEDEVLSAALVPIIIIATLIAFEEIRKKHK